MTSALQDLSFDNRFLRDLPRDEIEENYCRQVRGAAWSAVDPVSMPEPALISMAPEVAVLLGMDPTALDTAEMAEIFSGNRRLSGMETYATCYGGHQFGNWAGQLGDGRAIGLGQVRTQAGDLWELQLKGAGPTPYSRGADGRAVMRSSVREYLCSEAMHHLGVPTSRALALVGTGESVVRDMFYDGNPAPEPGAIVCRVAPSFLRFGNFELATSRSDDELLRQLADHAIHTHFPHLGEPGPAVYGQWLAEVGELTANMVVHWMRVGFVHGVMNTDNMSIHGITIDYGPYGWLEGFDPTWTPNTTDEYGRRYCFGNQPRVASWNLFCLANSLYPLLGATEPMKEAMEAFGQTLGTGLRTMHTLKLGLDTWQDADQGLVDALDDVLQLTETDMPIFFRRLADVPTSADASDAELLLPLLDAYYVPEELVGDKRQALLDWLRVYTARVRHLDVAQRRETMCRTNPKYVPRNYLAQLAIDAAEQGDGSKLDELLEVLRRPYDDQPENESYAAKRPEWARNRPGCSTLSCSS